MRALHDHVDHEAADPPTGTDAFAEAEALERSWLARLDQPTDTRPWWVRRQWRAWDRKAGLA